MFNQLSSMKSGYLMKMSNSGLVKRYIKWWFQISDNQLSCELIWHTSESSNDSKGRINLEVLSAFPFFFLLCIVYVCCGYGGLHQNTHAIF
jgi:hypothetical protein